ncbi:MAG: rhodanese-like domain-containing protein [Pseudomonadota bacterium]
MLLWLLLISMSSVAVLTGCGQMGAGAEDAAQRLVLLGRDIIHAQEVVTPEELSDWIIKERQDLVILDVRSKKAFKSGHIQGARNVPLTYLFEADSIDKLPEDRMIILYSDATRMAAEATAVVRMAGKHAYFLKQGYQGWQDQILQQRQIFGEGDKELQKRIAVSCYFSGNYKTDSGAGFTPQLQALQPAISPTSEEPKKIRRKRRKPKAEGC